MKNSHSSLTQLVSGKHFLAIGIIIMFFTTFAASLYEINHQVSILPTNLLAVWAVIRMSTTALYIFYLRLRFNAKVQSQLYRVLFQYAICELPTLVLSVAALPLLAPNAIFLASAALLFLDDAGAFLASLTIYSES